MKSAKNLFIGTLLLLLTNFVFAQNQAVYQFTAVKDLKATSVKNQFRSSTCWSFSTLSMIESEILRISQKEVDLSEMFIVYESYMAKADRYVRLHGECNFPAGGSSIDVINVWKMYGLMPDAAYKGLEYGEEKHNHKDMDKVLKSYISGIANEETKSVSANWKKTFTAMLESYLGNPPAEFVVDGKKYTAKTYAESLKINPDDYVKLSSFTHHPFYTQFALEVPDNWAHGTVYNVTIDELQRVAENAINNGYTVAWGGDVSEKGFSWKNGVAIIPDEQNQDNSGTDRDKWESMSSKDKTAEVYKFEKIVKEMTVTQEMRQKAFDNYSTTDDHGMHITGLAKDQNGNVYFKVKNSWDVDNPYQGYLYMSMPFFRYKTMDIMVHKNALPADVKAKLNLVK